MLPSFPWCRPREGGAGVWATTGSGAEASAGLGSWPLVGLGPDLGGPLSGPPNGASVVPLSREVWADTGSPWSPPLSPAVFYSFLPPAGLSFPFCTMGKAATSNGDLGSGPGHTRPRSWAANGPPTTHWAPPLPPQLPPSGDTFAAGKVNPLQFKGSVPRWQ